MKQWLIGCTHFGHENIIRLAKRPFETLHEMNSTLTDNWNKTVGHDDVVYHLGDFAYRGKTPPVDYLNKLNGKIVLIKGNHDQNGWGEDLVTLYGKQRIVLCHYPIEEWDGWWNGSYHFHCHTHKHEFKSAERRGNVTVEAINYTPIRLEEAIERVSE